MSTPALPRALADIVADVQTAAAVIVLDGKARLMLTVDEICGLLDVSRRRVVGWIESGELPALNLSPGSSNGHYRIAVSAVLELVTRRDALVPRQ